MNRFQPQDTVIIITSDEPSLTEGNMQQHFLDIISAMFPVIYVSPPGEWHLENLLRRAQTIKSGSATFFRYKNYFPATILPRFTIPFNDWCNSRVILKIIPTGKQVVLWKFDSFRMLNTDPIKPAATIYHVADPFFERFTDHRLAENADLVVTVNNAFLKHYKKLNPQVMFVPHGIRTEDTVADDLLTQEIHSRFGDFFLMAGSINNDVDFDLLGQIAENFPRYTLLLIGNNVLTNAARAAQFQQLLTHQNVKFYGAVDYRELKNYVAAAKVCLVTYDTHRKNFFRNPIKITNYVAQLKPVVNTVNIPELKELEGRIVFTAVNHADFIKVTGDVIAEKLQVDINFVKEYTVRNNYQRLAVRILDAVENAVQQQNLQQ